MNNTQNMSKNMKQAGFSMLEVLITIFVLSVGLLGVAGMQATSITLSHEAHLRSQASLLAYDIADRMRANADGAEANAYDGTHTGTSAFDNGCANPAGAACDSGRIATLDINNWDFKLGQTFPGVQATILTVNDLNLNHIVSTITLTWVDAYNEADDDADRADTERQFILTTVI